MTRKPTIAIIGTGWAGLAAAEQLSRLPADITIFEAGRQAGGRARTLAAASEFAAPDNGQHIMVGAYHQVLAILERCGVREDEAFLRLPMQWHLADGLRFQAKNLPAPWHLLAGVLLAKGIAWGEKTTLLRQMRALQKQPLDKSLSVAVWLRRQQASRPLLQMFWQPLVWGAMNTGLEEAALWRLQAVLRDGVWQSRAGSEFLLPKQDLGRLFVQPVCRRLQQAGVALHTGTRASAIRTDSRGRLQVNDRPFDRVLVATAPYHAAALLPEDSPPEIAAALNALSYHAITTIYLRYPQPLTLPAPICGLAEGTAQWLIDREALGLGRREVAAVVSLSDQHGKPGREEWAARIHADVLRLCPAAPAPVAALVVSEKRATSASRVGQGEIPQAWLRHRGIYLAGDYLHPLYPATLEAAVQSGQQAAAQLWSDCLQTQSQ